MLDRKKVACYAAVMESGCIDNSCLEVCELDPDEGSDKDKEE